MAVFRTDVEALDLTMALSYFEACRDETGQDMSSVRLLLLLCTNKVFVPEVRRV